METANIQEPLNINTDEIPVKITALFRKTNRVEPMILWQNEKAYKITHVLDMVRGETLKRRGAGIRYKVRIKREEYEHEIYLFRIGDIWYWINQDDANPDVQTRHAGINANSKKIIDSQYDNPYKANIEVVATFYEDGSVEPHAFYWDDGAKYLVDYIDGKEQAVSLKAGIIGTRYKIRVKGRETSIFRDDDMWYMERKAGWRVLDVHGRPVE